MVEPIYYWVHMLVKFDPITGKSEVIKNYTNILKKKKPEDNHDNDEFVLPKSLNTGTVEL